MSKSGHPFPVLVFAILAVSAAAPLAKIAEDVHPIAIGFWRTLAVGLILLLSVRRRHLNIESKDLLMGLAAGALLAGHFWAWFASLSHISALRSTVLVCLNPIWAGILEGIFLKKKPSIAFWIGTSLAIFGISQMGGENTTHDTVTGDGLALLGGVLGAAYLLVGRSVRQRVEIGPYGSLICLSCALWLGLAAFIGNFPLSGHAQLSWAVLALMAVGPQLTGHIGLNYAVRYVPAATVAMLLLFEPVGAALIAWKFLGEEPSSSEILGSAIILMGLFIGLLSIKNSESTKIE